jgi:uncharacterized protein YkwD
MCGRILPVILLASLFFFSCKKNDVITGDSSDQNDNNSGTIVYHVNKTELLQLINDVRNKGCTCGSIVMPPVGNVVWNDQLAKAAYDHSKEMNENDYFSHTGLDGSDPGQRITGAGYSWQSYGENIAEGYTKEQTVVNAWLNSEGHCKNIMNGGYNDMGVGRDGNYWTQDFGSK